MQGDDLRMFITQAIGFVLYILVLMKVAVKPIRGLLDERQATIVQSFSDIETQRADLAKQIVEYQGQLATVEQTAAARQTAAVADGARMAAQLEAEARARYAEVIAKGEADLLREIAKARIQFRDEIAQAATQAAEAVIASQMNATLHRSLIDRYIEDLARVG